MVCLTHKIPDRFERADQQVGALAELATETAVSEVLAILEKSSLPTHQIRYIVESVEGAGGIPKRLAKSGKQFTRFWRTLHDREALGIDALHPVAPVKKLKNPMSLIECEQFARAIGHRWIAEKVAERLRASSEPQPTHHPHPAP